MLQHSPVLDGAFPPSLPLSSFDTYTRLHSSSNFITLNHPSVLSSTFLLAFISKSYLLGAHSALFLNFHDSLHDTRKTLIIFIMRFATIFAVIALFFASFVSAMPKNNAYPGMEARALNARGPADV
jgi:hypothetical protein